MKRVEEIKAKSEERRAKGKGQRARSRVRRAKGKGPGAESLIAVDFSKRTAENSSEPGLQPNKMWLKPIVKIITCVRQLKQTAKSEGQSAKGKEWGAKSKVQSAEPGAGIKDQESSNKYQESSNQ